VTSPNDPLSDIFSQIAADDAVDPAVFDQSLEAAFDFNGAGFDELVPDSDDSSTEGDIGGELHGGTDGDDTLFDTDDSGDTDDADTDADEYTTDFTTGPDTADDYSAGDDLTL
jgi:hypothetical protein